MIGRVWLCWSPSQQAVHIEEEAEGFRTNLQAFMSNQPVDYVPLAVFANRRQAAAFARQVRELRNQRQGGVAKWN